MCKHGTTVEVEVTIPDYRYTTMEGVKLAHKKICLIDSCIASIVEALEKGGVLMSGSCCGHGKRDGSILLQDGRELVIKNEWRHKP